MLNARAPRRLRGWLWLGLGLSLALTVAGSVARAQQGAEEAPDAAPAEEPGVSAAQQDAAIDPKEARTNEAVELYEDPQATQLLDPDGFPEVPNPPGRPIDRNAILGMARSGARIDAAAIQRFVDSQLHQLTSHENLRALVDPTPNPDARSKLDEQRRVDAFEQATKNLLDVVRASRGMPAFRAEVDRVLLDRLPKLLEGHLMVRTQAMLILSQLGNADALPIFVQQLKNDEQVLSVRMLAALGTTAVAQDQRTLKPGQDIEAAQALTIFLDALDQREAKFWPAYYRALEALGWLRQSTANSLEAQADYAQVALAYLADPEEKPVIRAEAAWALGMMRVNDLNPDYNFRLLAYHMGRLAADLGAQIIEIRVENPARARHYTELLLQIVRALSAGEPDPSAPERVVTDSGLLNSRHRELPRSRAFIGDIDRLVRDLARAAVELNRAVAAQVPRQQAVVTKALGDLEAYLGKNTPPSWSLVPGGPEFRPASAQVAGDPPPGPGDRGGR